MKNHFMIVVAGFAFREKLSLKEAHAIRNRLNHCVQGVRVERMEVEG